MRLLLDTQCWLWMRTEPGRFSDRVRDLLTDANTGLLLSAASSWEIAIKYALGKLPLPERPAKFVPARLREDNVEPLAITHVHALGVAELPMHHRDPFDRILVAQSRVERLPLLTADRLLGRYEVELIWATDD